MFANYPAGEKARSLRPKFENVEPQPSSEHALMGDMLKDIRQRAAALIADRQRLLDAHAQLNQEILSLRDQLNAQRAELEERDMRLAGLETKVAEHEVTQFYCITSMSTEPNAQKLRTANLQKAFGVTVFERFVFLDTGADKNEVLDEYVKAFEENFC